MAEAARAMGKTRGKTAHCVLGNGLPCVVGQPSKHVRSIGLLRSVLRTKHKRYAMLIEDGVVKNLQVDAKVREIIT